MEILIPSKNIYSINNKKIRDNFVSETTVERKKITQDNKKGTVFSNDIAYSEFSKYSKGEHLVEGNGITIAYDDYYESIAGVAISTEYGSKRIKVPKVSENRLIQEIFNWSENRESSGIDFSIEYETREGSATGKVEITTPDNIIHINDGYNSILYSLTFSDTTVTASASFDPAPLDVEVKASTDNSLAKIQKTIEDETTISNVQSNDVEDCWEFDVNILSYIRVTFLVFNTNQTLVYGEMENGVPAYHLPTSLVPRLRNLSGTYKEYIPKKITISCQGISLGIKIDDTDIVYGSGNKPFSLSGNEYLQEGTTTNGTPTTEFLANNVSTQYAQGKETATLLCDINEYFLYDSTKEQNKGDRCIPTSVVVPFPTENLSIRTFDMGHLYWVIEIALPQGQYTNVPITVQYSYTERDVKHVEEAVIAKGSRAVLISLEDEYNVKPQNLLILDATTVEEKPIFDLGDVVVPMVFGANGQDSPMSKNQDENPKKFAVVGAKMIYDGAVWQELTLQEFWQEEQ